MKEVAEAILLTHQMEMVSKPGDGAEPEAGNS
jgi:hypothetical protein